jgi:hypothetical protein
MVQFQWCKLFKETFSEKARLNPELKNLFDDFRRTKEANPNQPYGSRDASFHGDGIFSKKIPKLRHAHLMHDLNLCYTISGKDPTIIKLYGVFKHDELGTGQPANIKRQKNVAATMANQSFADIPSSKQATAPTKPNDYKNAAWYKNQQG